MSAAHGRSGVVVSLHELAQLLARDHVTSAQVVAYARALRSAMPGIRETKLVSYPETGLPFFLRCEFAADSMPSVADLVDMFGTYRITPIDRGMPVPLLFEPVARSAACTVALIADLPPGTSPTDDARVPNVSLRRDPS